METTVGKNVDTDIHKRTNVSTSKIKNAITVMLGFVVILIVTMTLMYADIKKDNSNIKASLGAINVQNISLLKTMQCNDFTRRGK